MIHYVKILLARAMMTIAPIALLVGMVLTTTSLASTDASTTRSTVATAAQPDCPVMY
jgi:hypothetical protein